MKTILGLVRPHSGTVTFDGDTLNGLATGKIVSRGISMVPEARRVFGRMTVWENLQIGAYTRRAEPKDEIDRDLDRVYGLFPRLRERAGQYAGTMSGGEQQMLAIGRALMARPRLLLMDEPSMGLSPALVDQVFDIIQEINRQGVDHPGGRAECRRRAVDRASRLCPAERPHHAQRQRKRPAGGRGRAARLSGRGVRQTWTTSLPSSRSSWCSAWRSALSTD